MRTRLNVSCAACRTRRVACYEGSSKGNGPCEYCETWGQVCVSAETGAPRESDVKIQIARLQAVLSLIELDEEEKSHPQCYRDERVEVFDAVGETIRYCVHEDLVERWDKMPEKERDKLWLVNEMLDTFGKLSGPPPRQQSEVNELYDADLLMLIALLPPWEEVERLLFDWPKHWSFTYDVLFLPSWPYRVRLLYNTSFKPTPDAHTIAEIFAVLACIKSALARGSQDEDKLQAESDYFAACAHRALELLPPVDQPTLRAARALNLLATRGTHYGSGDGDINDGLGLLKNSISLVEQLGLNLPDDNFPGESAQTAFERQALVMSLTSNEWVCQPACGRRAMIDPAAPRPSPPLDLHDRDLTRESRTSPWRLSPVIMDSVRARHAMLSLQQEILEKLYHDRVSCDYSQVAGYGRRIAEIEASLPPNWHIREDALTREYTFAVVDVPSQEMSARYQTTTHLAKLGLSLHRPLAALCGRAQNLPDDYDLAWHRKELLRFSRIMLRNIVCFSQELHLSFVSFWCYTFEALIAAALHVAAEPNDPAVNSTRALLQQVIDQLSLPTAPLGAKRTAATAQYLISLSREDWARITRSKTSSEHSHDSPASSASGTLSTGATTVSWESKESGESVIM